MDLKAYIKCTNTNWYRWDYKDIYSGTNYVCWKTLPMKKQKPIKTYIQDINLRKILGDSDLCNQIINRPHQSCEFLKSCQKSNYFITFKFYYIYGYLLYPWFQWYSSYSLANFTMYSTRISVWHANCIRDAKPRTGSAQQTLASRLLNRMHY
jgi:hypothetical protein